MIELIGYYFDGEAPVARTAKLRLVDHTATLIVEDRQEPFALDQLKTSPSIGRTSRFIGLPNGGQFSCANDTVLSALPQESKTEGPVHWLEERWGAALAAVALIAGATAWGYFNWLPKAAKSIAARIPIQTERKLGESALKAMDGKLMAPSNLGDRWQTDIRNDFSALTRGLPFRGQYRVEFRDAPYLGPNAFALPGGIIVVTDQLVHFADTEDEIVAVLAHEAGHVELRHILRNLLQSSAVGAVATAITHDAATVTGSAASMPLIFAHLAYSRELEAEADDFAFDLLRKRGYSPVAFRSFMERVAAKYGESGQLAFLSSHPSPKDRAEKALKAAIDLSRPIVLSENTMAPQLWKGQSISVEPVASLKHALSRGEIVAIRSKAKGLVIKRVIGLPGDQVAIHESKIYVNGADTSKGRVSPSDCKKQMRGIYGIIVSDEPQYQCYYELAGSRRYLVFAKRNTSLVSADEVSTRTVPNGHYFVAEDNRLRASWGGEPDGGDADIVSSKAILGVSK